MEKTTYGNMQEMDAAELQTTNGGVVARAAWGRHWPVDRRMGIDKTGCKRFMEF